MFGLTTRFVILLSLLSSLVAVEDYTFSYEGRPVHATIYPVEGKQMGAPTAGDIAFLFEDPFDPPIVLDEAGHYQFRFRESDHTLLMCRIDDGPEYAIAARVVRPSDGKDLRNPLLTMTPEEKSRLRGIFLEQDPGNWEESLADVDWKRTALTIGNVSYPLPKLPPDLRYLRLAPTQPQDDYGFERLSNLHELRYLFIQSSRAPFPVRVITGATSLVNLEIGRGTRIRQPDALSELTRLRFLKLRHVKGLDALAWASQLEALRVLKVDDTDVSDLEPLTKLPNLRLLSINGTDVATLPPPGNFPALRDFRLHSTPAAKDKKALTPYRPAMSVSVNNWDDAIRAFGVQDYKFRKAGAIVFVGSSSIRSWDLPESFPGFEVRNRGFGGSELSDALIHYDKLILPNQPKAIILYAGDNDIANGETAEQVVADWKKFAQRTRKKLPTTQLAYLPIKPSPARWHHWPEMEKANAAIAHSAKTDPHLHYLDTATPMLGKDGKPREELFVEDGLHLNAAGYAAWTAAVRPWIDSLPE